MIKGIHHMAVVTTDLARLSRFYVDTIGFEIVSAGGWEPGVEVYDRNLELHDSAAQMMLLRAGNTYLEMFQFSNPPGRAKDASWRTCDNGYMHLCLEVTDINGEYQRMSDAGMKFNGPPFDGGTLRATYGKDPDGNIIELLETEDRDQMPPLAHLLGVSGARDSAAGGAGES
jgi:catechol 2,3-dioxygenase-like lactoylglutathione lyase family enzyme